jgi:hypothetical protein
MSGTAAPAVKLEKLDRLRPAAINPRTHSPEQVEQLARAISRFGWTVPILYDYGEDETVAGHGRQAAAQLIYGAGNLIFLPPGPENGGAQLPKGTVPVMDVTGWTTEERAAYLLADNALAEQAGWDYGSLGEQLRMLDDAGFDMGVIGFSTEALDDFLGRANVGEFPNLPDGDRQPFQQFTFTLHDSQAATLNKALARAKEAGPLDNVNENSNGNALARICAQYLKGRDA